MTSTPAHPRAAPPAHGRPLTALLLAVALLLAPIASVTGQDATLPQEPICRSSGDLPRVVDPLALIRWALETSAISDRALDADDDGDTLLEEKQLALVDPAYCQRETATCDSADRAAQERIHAQLDAFVREQGGPAYRFERLRRPDPLERNGLAFLAERFEVVDRQFQLGEVLAVPARFVRIVCLDRRSPPPAVAAPHKAPAFPVRTGFRLAGSLDDLGKDRDQLRSVRPAEFSINADVGEGETTYYANLFAGYEIALGQEDDTNYSAIPFVQYEEKFNQSDVDIEKIGVGGQFQAVVISDKLGRDEFALTPYFLTDKKASKEILTVRFRATPSLPEDYGIPLGYYENLGGVLLRFGLDAIVETGNVFRINDDTPLEVGGFLRSGARFSLGLQGGEDTLLEQFEFEIADRFLHGFVNRPTNVNRFESTLSYRLPDAENYRLSLSYENGRVDDTFENKEVWRTALGVRF